MVTEIINFEIIIIFDFQGCDNFEQQFNVAKYIFKTQCFKIIIHLNNRAIEQAIQRKLQNTNTPFLLLIKTSQIQMPLMSIFSSKIQIWVKLESPLQTARKAKSKKRRFTCETAKLFVKYLISNDTVT